MNILLWPDERLKLVSDPVSFQLDPVLLNSMHELMRNLHGVGLSAIQVNIPLRFFIIDIGKGLEVYINPEIIQTVGIQMLKREGCLSMPGYFDYVQRYPNVKVKYLDANLTPCERHLSGMRAHVFQHEIEHLDGIVMADRLTPEYQEKLKTILQNGEL